ncbi:MAG: hypothetical protein II565_07340 [Fibrobacter sp.]|nr:hypothetical protein [Fibrobacter sp.]MBQ5462525.1 hypothetical protein [Fibrobacter sp.]
MKKSVVKKSVQSFLDKKAKEKQKKEYVDSLLAVQAKDSSNILAVEPNAGLDSAGLVSDSAGGESVAETPQLPTPEQLGISITTAYAGDTLRVTKGDTVDFPVTVSWNAGDGSVLVLPMSTANAKDVMQVAMSQESSRIVKDGHEMAQITFNYKIVVQEEGLSLVPAMRFEIPTQMGQSLYLRSEPVVVSATNSIDTLVTVLGIVFALFWVVVFIWRMRRRSKVKTVRNSLKIALYAIREHMMILKQRVNVADSREWLLELEGVCKEFVALRLGRDASKVNLDYLVKDGKLEGWERLVDEFAHARYGGGKRDGFENKETWKQAMQLMGLKEED